jgi:hypothetical protein
MRAARWFVMPLAMAGGALLAAAAVSGVFAWMLAGSVSGLALGEERSIGDILLRSALLAAMALSAFAGAAAAARRPRLAAGLAALPVPLLLLHAQADPHPVFLAPAAVLLAAALAALWTARRR